MKVLERYVHHWEDIIPHHVYQRQSGRFTLCWLGWIIIFDKFWKKEITNAS
ncbi:hypothetical protein LCGC14_0598290 [marine sediment metagenome]|uniref:Uncharacterized protein n=1 Tax=marine sediment metagenome TaxID=412755 RepID=A0A0F9RBI9_9ZZZZ